MTDQGGVRAGSSEGQPNARCHLDHSCAEFQEAQTDGGELGRGERMCLRDGISDGEHEPVGGGVQDQPHLISEWAAAAGTVGGELGLV